MPSKVATPYCFPTSMKEFLLLFSLTSIWCLSLFQMLAILVGVWASHMALVKKNAPAMQETSGTQGGSLGREDPLERGMAPTPAFLPRESHGQRSLAGCSPWSHKEADTTEVTEHAVGV